MVWIHGGGLVGSAGSMHSGHQLAGKGAVFVTFKLPPRSAWILRAPGTDRGESQGRFRQPGVPRPDPSPGMGAGQYRGFRRRSGQRHHPGRVLGWHERRRPAGEPVGAGPVPSRHRPERRPVPPHARPHPDQSSRPPANPAACVRRRPRGRRRGPVHWRPCAKFLPNGSWRWPVPAATSSVYDTCPWVMGRARPGLRPPSASGNQADVPHHGRPPLPTSPPRAVEHLRDGDGARESAASACSPRPCCPRSREEVRRTTGRDRRAGHASWQDLLNDLNFNYPMRAWARGMTNVESDAYLYWFSWRPPIPERRLLRRLSRLLPDVPAGRPGLSGRPDGCRPGVSRRMLAETGPLREDGDPNGGPLPEWPAFNLGDEPYMELGPTLAVGKHRDRSELQ